jgi:transposase InsO family protein
VSLMRALRGIQRKQRTKSDKPSGNRYRHTFKVRAVQLYVDGGISAAAISRETGVSLASFRKWVKTYRELGEAGLQPRTGGSGNKRLAPPVREKIVELRQQNPTFGVKRISQLLRRVFLLPGSPETVRKTLHEQSLIEPPKRKRQRNITRPRFFERATPNQLWQTDIFTFRLGGRNAYLLGYIDDFSRYIVGLELYRSQTAENLLEVYRRAMGEYNPPREMLTDNGRQYTNWRGTTRFEKELAKEKVKHIKSQPHHPMTLGKIERFWKTIFTEYLGRTQFTSFEDARDRIRLWVKYYNHKRPHQGIGGLCPADRYFEVQTELRKTLQQGIKDNILEMALRGQPRSPFYMVGRMEGQSVVLRAEKGKLRVTVDDADNDEPREIVYDLSTPNQHGGDDNGPEAAEPASEEGAATLRCGGEGSGGAVAVVGEAYDNPSVPGTRYQVDGAQGVAEPGSGGDDAGAGTPGAASVGACAESAAIDAAQQAHAGDSPESRWPEAGAASGEAAGAAGPAAAAEKEVQVEEWVDERQAQASTGPGTCPQASGHHGGSAGREAVGGRCCSGVGDIAQDLLRVGAEGSGRDDRGDDQPSCGQTIDEARPAGTGPAAASEGSGERSHHAPGDAGGEDASPMATPTSG